MGGMDIANFETGPFAVETAGTEGREPSLVRQLRERVGLVDHLRKLATAEEELDAARNALGVGPLPFLPWLTTSGGANVKRISSSARMKTCSPSFPSLPTLR